ncbi:MAG: N-acetylmuramoyl-L-alanine amidase [Pseudomonadota bacterium]
MRVSNHRLLFSSGKGVTFDQTPNRSGTLTGGVPKYVVIHYTAGGTAQSAVNVFNNPNHKASAHLVVGHDGAITQMARFNEVCWHAGRSRWDGISGLNRHSVGIEIANWGWLNGQDGNWKSWVGTSVPDDRVIKATHKNENTPRGWEIFDEAQFDSCIAIVRALANAYGLGPAQILGHDDISPGRKQDPGPAWDMERFRSAVFGRDDDSGDVELTHIIVSSSGLNMRTGPGVSHDKIKNLKDGTTVVKIEAEGAWWLVSEMINGKPDDTGWVHSNWLRMS